MPAVQIIGKIQRSSSYTPVNHRSTFVLAEACVVDMVLRVLPVDFPKMRELKIQNAKLLRMLGHYPDTSGLSAKNSRKKVGERNKAIDTQYKALRTLLMKSFKEWRRQDNPKLTNAQFAKWTSEWNKAISQQASKFVADFRAGKLLGAAASKALGAKS